MLVFLTKRQMELNYVLLSRWLDDNQAYSVRHSMKEWYEIDDLRAIFKERKEKEDDMPRWLFSDSYRIAWRERDGYVDADQRTALIEMNARKGCYPTGFDDGDLMEFECSKIRKFKGYDTAIKDTMKEMKDGHIEDFWIQRLELIYPK